MRYKVYCLNNAKDNAVGYQIRSVCESDSLKVAEFALNETVERLGSRLTVLMVEDGKLIRAIPGSHMQAG